MKRSHAAINPRHQRGLSLLEILIAVLVLAVGVLGIAALQSVTLKNNQSSSIRTMAVIQSYSMMDMLRANREVARAGVYNQGFLCAQPDAADPGTPQAGRVNGDVGRWIAQLQQSIGESACGSIACGANECEIGVRWNDERATEGAQEQRVLTRTRL